MYGTQLKLFTCVTELKQFKSEKNIYKYNEYYKSVYTTHKYYWKIKM